MWVLAAALLIDIRLGCSKATDPDIPHCGSTDLGLTMALSGSTAYKYHGFRLKHRPPPSPNSLSPICSYGFWR